MPPLDAQPPAHCSSTWISRRSLPGRSRAFQFDKYVPRPASSSSRFVAVDVHFTFCTRCQLRLKPPVSGALVGLPAPTLLLLICSSQKTFTLLRGVTWNVNRRLG